MPRAIRKRAITHRPTTQKSFFETLGEVEQAGPPEKILGVGDFLDYVNLVLKVTEDVKVIGEISEFKILPSGVYLTLKDTQGEGIMDGYINPYAYRGLGMQLDIGMQIKVSGFPNIYKPKGRFSFRIENVELAGEGSLKKAYDLLKAKLEAEGLFAPERKRALPENITRIGIITSKTGAVIDDFRNNLDKLGIKVFLCDVRVEGNQAINQILLALDLVSRITLDTVVIMRGGGSLEDLQAFNNELVVRAIFQSHVPVIAAIGHDRDVPLCCLAADYYTSTPTAAAVLINNSWANVRKGIPELERAIVYAYQSALIHRKNRLSNLAQSLISQAQKIFLRQKQLEQKLLYATKAIGQRIQNIKSHITRTEQYLESNNPERNLKLGYSLIYSKNKIVRTTASLKVGDTLFIKLFKGRIDTIIKAITD